MYKLAIFCLLSLMVGCGNGQLFGDVEDGHGKPSAPESAPSEPAAPPAEPTNDNVQNCIDAGSIPLNAAIRLQPRLNSIRDRLFNALESECKSRIQ